MSVSRLDENDDREANYFAMQLLVPTSMLVTAVRELGGIDLSEEDGVIEKLARQFEVSTSCIAFRLAEEGLLKL